MTTFERITNTPPITDIDGAMWTLFVRNRGDDADIAIQVCEGYDFDPNRQPPVRDHQFDGEWHDGGDIHLFLDSDSTKRLLLQLQHALDRNAWDEAVRRQPGQHF